MICVTVSTMPLTVNYSTSIVLRTTEHFIENALDFEILKVFKYDNDQINWLNKNEKLIWTKLIENEILFSTTNIYYENLI